MLIHEPLVHLFIAVGHFMAQINHNVLILWPVDGHLSCFHLLLLQEALQWAC